MSLYTNVRRALRTRLNALPGGLPSMQWELKPFTPVLGTQYVREELKPGPAQTASLGAKKRVRHHGTYLLDCFVPTTADLSVGDTLADSLVEHFYHGLEVSYAGQRVLVRSANRSPALTETDWRHLPVTVFLQFDIILPV